LEWADAKQLSFNNLKTALTSESVLAHRKFALPFILKSDASNYAISVSQLKNGK
jgi:hypothetical protein